MKLETIPIGEKLLRQEVFLNELFANRKISSESLKNATSDISKTQGELREAHLRYHLYTARLLTADQLHKYYEIRGYSSDHIHK